MEFVKEAPEVALEHIQQWSIGPDPVLKNRVIDDIIHFLTGKYALGPSILFKYRLCLDESMTNAISHGCRGVPHAEVNIDFYWAGDCWAVRVIDPGPGFDPETIPDPNDPGNEYREHGRGIVILQRYTDRLVFSNGGREQTFWMDTTGLEPVS